jgi:hypothetical protein
MGDYYIGAVNHFINTGDYYIGAVNHFILRSARLSSDRMFSGMAISAGIAI